MMQGTRLVSAREFIYKVAQKIAVSINLLLKVKQIEILVIFQSTLCENVSQLSFFQGFCICCYFVY